MNTNILSAKGAAVAMLNGEVLYDEDGNENYWAGYEFMYHKPCEKTKFILNTFTGLFRKQESEPKNRLMTQWECLAWAQSEESEGWLVYKVANAFNESFTDLELPAYFTYNGDISLYRRVRFTKDGIDRASVTNFEVEEQV